MSYFGISPFSKAHRILHLRSHRPCILIVLQLLSAITTDQNDSIFIFSFVEGQSANNFENLRRIRDGSFKKSSLPAPGKVIAWLIDHDGLDQCNQDLDTVNLKIQELENDLEKLEAVSANHAMVQVSQD